MARTEVRRIYFEPVPRIHYELPEELHRRAKSAAALRGITLKEFVLRALEAAVDAVSETEGEAPDQES